MITERRRLTFSADELATAVSSYLQATRGMAKDDRVGDITITDPQNVVLTVVVYAADNTPPSTIELKPEAVAALLVAHCIRTKTPLPRRATKSIAVDGDRLSLMLAM